MAKFKVGDRVRALTPVGISGANGAVGKVIDLIGSDISVEFDVHIDGHACGGIGRPGHCWNLTTNYLELITAINKPLMSSILSTIKKITRQEPEKTFVQVGFIDDNENITEKGKEALEYILWNANKDALKTLADQVQQEESAKK